MTARRRGIHVSIRIAAPIDTVWRLTQEPAQHVRWDVRFSRIVPLHDLADGGTRFRYERALPGHVIHGLGTSIGERQRPDGTRTSALRFSSPHPLSLLAEGSGALRCRSTWEALAERIATRRRAERVSSLLSDRR